MSDRLLPCPFCGGEARIEKYWNDDNESQGFFVWCHGNDCVVEPVTGDFREEDAAIEAWNTRAERTCHRITHGLERYREIATVSWTCSECGEHIGETHRFCPNCGRKVKR